MPHDYARLIKPLPTPDGIIPVGAEGTVLLIYGDGAAYCVEFEGPWKVPETVPHDALAAASPNDWSSCPVVECVEGQCGGAPVLRGTRLPVAAILDNYDDGCTPEQIAQMFEVAVTDVQAVLAYRDEANR